VLNVYYLLSLSIIKDNTDYQIKALKFASKLSENIDLLSSQIIAILKNIEKHKLKSVQKSGILENLIEKLLKTNDQGDRLEIWDLCLERFYEKAISKEVLAKNKSYFIELLSSENEDIRRRAWHVVQLLIESGIISKEDAIYFIELLSSNEDIRWRAWLEVPLLIESGIISKEDVMNNKKYFIELLSSNEDIRWRAWLEVPLLIESGIISKEDVMNNKKYFIELLSSNEDIRWRAWDDVSKLIELIEYEIISKEDAIYFIELLSSNEDIRLLAWLEVPLLIESGIISKEDVMNNKKYFIELLSSKDLIIKIAITPTIPGLIKCGIFTEEELKRYAEGL